MAQERPDEFMAPEEAERDNTVDDGEMPLGAAIDYAERERGELPPEGEQAETP